jgi:hypothetical protein
MPQPLEGSRYLPRGPPLVAPFDEAECRRVFAAMAQARFTKNTDMRYLDYERQRRRAGSQRPVETSCSISLHRLLWFRGSLIEEKLRASAS